MREVIAMWESLVGLIGMALIVYLLVAIVRPEKF
jgi:K+-transporting ATPase KdpF subunit